MGVSNCLRVNRINVFYGDLQVLHDVTLDVKEGEIVAIIGSNGAGKTTTLNTISGLLTPQSGSIEFLGKEIVGLNPWSIAEMGLSHVPEGRELFPQMTVLENLYMGSYTTLAKKKRKENLELVFELFPHLKDRRKQIARTLSGGEQQMLAMGRGLMSEPKLYLIDEPSLGLAPNLVYKTFEAIKKIAEHKISILLVEQNVYYALQLSERAYVLETGKVSSSGNSKNLLQNDSLKKSYMGL